VKILSIKAVIFDLDGVIVSTDEYHYEAWKMIADEEKIYFDRKINEQLRGVSRMESLEIILRNSQRVYSKEEKNQLAEKKNDFYKLLLKNLTPADILPGVAKVLEGLKERNIKIAIGSSSKNTPIILERIRLDTYFDAIADGNDIKNSKPDPEVFLLAAEKLQIIPENCLIVEDADAGVEAALAGGMKVVGVGSASKNEKATFKMKDLTCFDFDKILN
jgi:beta-phosphoglucomutase